MKNEKMTYDHFLKLVRANDQSEIVKRLKPIRGLNFDLAERIGNSIHVTFNLTKIMRFIQSQDAITIKQHERAIKKLQLEKIDLERQNKELRSKLQSAQQNVPLSSRRKRRDERLEVPEVRNNDRMQYNETNSDPAIWSKDYTFRKF